MSKYRKIVGGLGALCAAACVTVAFAQARVTPPPLPVGSTMAKPDAGMSEPERKRAVRAHHNKTHYKKDLARDDSVGTGTSSSATGAARQ